MSVRDPQLYSQLRHSAERSYRVGRAAAELAVSAGNAHRANGVGVVRGSADVALKYRKLKTEAGLRTHPMEEGLFRLAGDTATVSGLVLSGIALPAMARKTATSFQELRTLLDDPTATASARLDKIEQLTRAGAGTIFSAQGVVVGTQGTVGILSRSEGIARLSGRVGQTSVVQAIGKPLGVVLRVLLPVADLGVLVGEAIATRRAFLDPGASGWQRVRKVVDLSLATLKASFWLLPAARPLKATYAAASFGQLLLTLRDFWPTVQPALQRAGQAAVWAVGHPGEAVRAVGQGVAGGLLAAGAALVTAGQVGWRWVSQPAATWAALVRFVDPVVGLLRRNPGGAQDPAVPSTPAPVPAGSQGLAVGAPGPAEPAVPMVPEVAPGPALPAVPLVPEVAPGPAVPAVPLVPEVVPGPAVPAVPVVPEVGLGPAVPAVPVVPERDLSWGSPVTAAPHQPATVDLGPVDAVPFSLPQLAP
ncbi:MAG: hypothetical protein VKQ33_00610 [Candidatus Sericytochromatia bacterium]|nr:hypothetical protein [Candidatus Sericytochromatia bacterium]